MWAYALAFVASGLLVALGALRQEQPLTQPLVIFFAPICVFSGWRLGAGVLLVRHAKERGWRIGWGEFALSGGDLAGFGAARVPARTDWQTLPAYDEALGEMDNLRLAIGMAKGWDVELERDRQLVCVYHASVPEMAAMVANLLAEEGFRARPDEPTSGAYRFSWGAKVYVPAREEAAARAFLAEHLGEFGDIREESETGHEESGERD